MYMHIGILELLARMHEVQHREEEHIPALHPVKYICVHIYIYIYICVDEYMRIILYHIFIHIQRSARRRPGTCFPPL